MSDIVRGDVGSGERRIREIFALARKAAPSIVFIDEFQAVFSTRTDDDSKSVGASLSTALAGCFDDIATWNEYAGSENLVAIIGATNEPWAIDNIFLRYGRLEKLLYIGELSTSGRRNVLTNAVPLDSRNVAFEELDKALSEAGVFTRAEVNFFMKKAFIELASESKVADSEEIYRRCQSIVVGMLAQDQAMFNRDRFSTYQTWRSKISGGDNLRK